MKTYDEFINNILNTRGRFACGDEYHERHHIIPKCMDGTNDEENLIDLFPKEHFEAHKLLVDLYPDNEKIIFAYTCMAFVNTKHQYRYELTPDEYADAKFKLSKIQKERMSDPKNNPMYGKHHTEETRKKLSEAIKNLPEEIRKKIDDAHKGVKMSEEFRIQRSIARLGKPSTALGKHWKLSEEVRRKQSESAKKKYESDEARLKTSESLKGKYTGENSNNAKAVVQLTTKDEFIAYFWGARQVEQELGIRACNVTRCCRKIKGYRSAGGFHWMYREEYDDINQLSMC